MTSTLAQHATLLLDDHYGTYVSPIIDTGSGYAARPAGAKSVHYIGPNIPSDWQAADIWTDTSGAGSGN